MKTVCSKHQQAYDTTSSCPYCVPTLVAKSEPARMVWADYVKSIANNRHLTNNFWLHLGQRQSYKTLFGLNLAYSLVTDYGWNVMYMGHSSHVLAAEAKLQAICGATHVTGLKFARYDWGVDPLAQSRGCSLNLLICDDVNLLPRFHPGYLSDLERQAAEKNTAILGTYCIEIDPGSMDYRLGMYPNYVTYSKKTTQGVTVDSLGRVNLGNVRSVGTTKFY